MAKQTQADFYKGYKDATDYFNKHFETSGDLEDIYYKMCDEFSPPMFWAKHQFKVINTKYYKGCAKAINEVFNKSFERTK